MFAAGEEQTDAGTEGAPKGEQSPYALEGGVALASPRPFYLSRGVLRECPSKLPQYQDPTSRLPCPRTFCPGEDVRQAYCPRYGGPRLPCLSTTCTRGADPHSL